MRRREFIAALAGAAAWPVAGRTQQHSMPVIGFLSSLVQVENDHLLRAFLRGLKETGLEDGKNVVVEYRYAAGDYGRLPALAAEFAQRKVSAILAQAPPAALAAKGATASIPIVFVVGLDPVAAGLVASMSRPGANATGVTLITAPLGQKRLELLLELVPTAATLGMLVNPASPDTVPDVKAVEAAARAYARRLNVLNAASQEEIAAAFGRFAQQRVGALLMGSDPFFLTQRAMICALAARHKLPAIYPFREFTAAGGLISYGTSLANAYRQAGIYTGRILQGAKPVDLPVLQPTTFELVINLKAARELGLAVPATLHARADEVIE